MDRSPKAFRADLNRLWREGYCPVSLHDYLNNRINVPMGKSPVILTFDDSRESQLRFLDDNTVDPDCAMGILLAFHKKHPDFALEATFYVVPDHLFGANSQRVKKLRMLHDLDHTVTHPTLSKLTDAAVQQEFAGCLARTRKLAPSVIMETIALPKGVFPRNRSLLASGRYQSQKYTHRAVLLGGYCPAQSPVSPRCNPMRLPRIVAHEKHMGITYWLNELKRHPERRYVSDGDPQIITVPKSAAPKVNKKKLRGANLRVY
jgi:peptidoglycan/xylan/chitin deacetylase (PgdA/CDA1 family)